MAFFEFTIIELSTDVVYQLIHIMDSCALVHEVFSKQLIKNSLMSLLSLCLLLEVIVPNSLSVVDVVKVIASLGINLDDSIFGL
jgi:hypothetical protein